VTTMIEAYSNSETVARHVARFRDCDQRSFNVYRGLHSAQTMLRHIGQDLAESTF
jgi:hypothetical protein